MMQSYDSNYRITHIVSACKEGILALEQSLHKLGDVLQPTSEEKLTEHKILKGYEDLQRNVKNQAGILQQLTWVFENMKVLFENVHGVPAKPKMGKMGNFDEPFEILFKNTRGKITGTLLKKSESETELLQKFHRVLEKLDTSGTDAKKLHGRVLAVSKSLQKKLDDLSNDSEAVIEDAMQKKLRGVLVSHEVIGDKVASGDLYYEVQDDLDDHYKDVMDSWEMMAKDRRDNAKDLKQDEWMSLVDTLSLAGPSSALGPSIGVSLKSLPDMVKGTTKVTVDTFLKHHRELSRMDVEELWDDYGDLLTGFQKRSHRIRKAAYEECNDIVVILKRFLHGPGHETAHAAEQFLSGVRPLRDDVPLKWHDMMRSLLKGNVNSEQGEDDDDD